MLTEFSHIPASCAYTHSLGASLGLGQVSLRAEVLGCCRTFAPHAERVGSSKKWAVLFCIRCTAALGLLRSHQGAEGSAAGEAPGLLPGGGGRSDRQTDMCVPLRVPCFIRGC